MSAPGLAARLAAPTTVRFRKLADGAVVLDLETGHLYSLDATAARMWAAIVGADCLGDARDALLEVFEVPPERLERDLVAFVGELVARGLLREAE